MSNIEFVKELLALNLISTQTYEELVEPISIDSADEVNQILMGNNHFVNHTDAVDNLDNTFSLNGKQLNEEELTREVLKVYKMLKIKKVL